MVANLGDKLDSSKAKVLVIDDEKIMCQSLSAYLDDSGFEVFDAPNGQDGIEIFNAEHPDIVITDLQMANMGGLEVLAKIHEMSENIPIIVISGVGSMDDVIESLRLGAWDYLTKPINDLEVLEHSIRNALERKRLIEENKRYSQKLARNLQILKEDQEAGRSVQMRLLPTHNVRFGNYLFNHNVSPSLYLSGDFLEYFTITEDKVGVYLADVSGHGVSSAFVTVLLRSLIEQCYARFQVHNDQTIVVPEQLMEELSFEIHAAKLGKYMTMVYGIIDLSTNEFVYGVAGHYPNPILLQADGTIEYLSGSGFPIGIMKNATYEANKITIPEGGHLIMLSDGIMEIFLEGKDMEAKDAGLLEIIKENNADIPLVLQAAGFDPSLEHQPDDITILTMSRLAPDE